MTNTRLDFIQSYVPFGRDRICDLMPLIEGFKAGCRTSGKRNESQAKTRIKRGETLGKGAQIKKGFPPVRWRDGKKPVWR
jgi:hypothetical protein